jgi:hypothetical protein
MRFELKQSVSFEPSRFHEDSSIHKSPNQLIKTDQGKNERFFAFYQGL